MPYKSSKIIIEKSKHDRRIKLTDDDRQLIREIYAEGVLGYQKIANIFNVSKRTVYWVINPEKKAKNLELRKQRGGSSQYYDKEKHKEYMKDHRRYKHELFKKKEI
jgi:DNA invertase Pin-like site-specific DNA recombinase